MYEPDDKMISLIRDNYNLLQSLGSFGISLGFGDKTVKQVCEEQKVDTYTFLAVVNFTINGNSYLEDVSKLSVPTLLQYLRASHAYYIEFQLPFIRRELMDALDENDSLAKLIMKLYDEYARSVTTHMKYEERNVYPYVEALLEGKVAGSFEIDMYSKHHSQESTKLRELKSIIIKYYPGDGNAQLMGEVLMEIYMTEEDLQTHCHMEDTLFAECVRRLECRVREQEAEGKVECEEPSAPQTSQDGLSEREKQIIVQLVEGKSNKEVAEALFISVNTVMTHRRNISRKLQIHSTAGLTIYAIVNGLVKLEDLKL